MISVGDSLPQTELIHATGGPGSRTDFGALGKIVALVAIPGAFTPVCSARHLPGFVRLAGEFKSKGVDSVACLSVNDPFVMAAWGEQHDVGDAVMMLADPYGDFTKAIGMEKDLSDIGLGVRSHRYSLLARDGKVTVLNLDEGSDMVETSAEKLLAAL